MAGSSLPPEQNLADQFEVSRNVVREALKVLQERGLVKVVDGSGTFVIPPDSTHASVALSRYIRLIGANSAIDSLYETRIVLEGFNARLAAERATDEQINEMESYVEKMRENINSHEIWTETDLDFHVLIAKATNNPFQPLLLEPLVEQLRGVISEGFAKKGATQRGLLAHIQLMECIKNHDPEGAYQTMVDHLNDSKLTVRESLIKDSDA